MSGHKKEVRPGVWKLRVSAGKDPATGKYLYFSKTIKGGPRIADRELADLVVSTASGREVHTTVKFVTLLERWLDHASPRMTAKTIYIHRRHIVRTLVPRLGAINIDKLNASHLDALYRSMSDAGASGHTIRQVHSVARSALGQAVKWGWLEKNVASLATPPYSPPHAVVTPSPKEVELILEETAKINPQIARAFAMGALTGARRGEVLGLKLSDFDSTQHVLRIRRSISYTPDTGVAIKDTKTHSERRVSLDQTAEALIRSQMDLLRTMTESGFELVNDPFLFFAEPDGSTPFHPDTPSKIFRKVCDGLGLPYHLHQLRHFTATQLIGAGVDVRTVSGRLGHSDPSVTLRVYSHVLEQKDREAAEFLGSQISFPKPSE